MPCLLLYQCVKTEKEGKKKYLYNYFQMGYYFHENYFVESFY